MLTKRAKWVMPIGPILGILICVVGCANLADNFNTKDPSEKLPIRTLSIRVDKDQREELFSQLRKFSEKHHLSFDLSFYRDKEIFFIVMSDETIDISGLSKPITTTELDINFYAEDPTNPPSQEMVNELYNDLRMFISEIPNVTISDEK